MNDFKEKELHKVALKAFVINNMIFDSLLSVFNFLNIVLNIVIFFCIKQNIYLFISSLFFFISLSNIFKIFITNRVYLENILKGKYENDPNLEKLDKNKLLLFYLGYLFLLVSLILVFITK